MKKLLSAFIGATFFLFSLPLNLMSFADEYNADDVTDVKDIIILQKYLLGKRNLSETEFYTADLNHDGIVNIYDMIYAKRILIRK